MKRSLPAPRHGAPAASEPVTGRPLKRKPMACYLAIALCTVPLLAQAQENCTTPNNNANYILGEVDGAPAAVHWITGLVWQRCLQGQGWNAATSTCTGTPTTATWVDWADSQGQALLPYTFGDQDDWGLTDNATFGQDLLASGAWRMPYRKELVHLTMACGTNPQINQTVFPGTPPVDQWTGSPAGHMGGLAFSSLVSFNNGTEAATIVSAPYMLRTVRGGQPFAPLAATPLRQIATAAGQVIAFPPVTVQSRSGAGQSWGGARATGAGNPSFQVNGTGPWVQEAIVKSGDQLVMRVTSPALAGDSTAELSLRSSEGFPTGEGGRGLGMEDHYPHSTAAAFTVTFAAPPLPSGATPVPSLSEWALALLMLACAGLGLRRLRAQKRI